MNDLALLRNTAVPRDPLVVKPLLRRFHPTWYFAITCTLLVAAVSLCALMIGGLAAIIYVLSQHGFSTKHDYLIPWITLGVVGVSWLLLAFRFLPRYVRGITDPTRDALREADLFDVQLVDVYPRFAIRKARRLEYKLYFERDGARFYVFSPVPSTQVLHRLNTHVAITFDRTGRAHTARATPIW